MINVKLSLNTQIINKKCLFIQHLFQKMIKTTIIIKIKNYWFAADALSAA